MLDRGRWRLNGCIKDDGGADVMVFDRCRWRLYGTGKFPFIAAEFAPLEKAGDNNIKGSNNDACDGYSGCTCLGQKAFKQIVELLLEHVIIIAG